MRAVAAAASRLLGDHREARRHQLGADVERPGGADVHRRLRALAGQQAEDAAFVGRQVAEDPLVGGVGVVGDPDVRGSPQQLGAPLAQRGTRAERRRSARSRRARPVERSLREPARPRHPEPAGPSRRTIRRRATRPTRTAAPSRRPAGRGSRPPARRRRSAAGSRLSVSALGHRLTRRSTDVAGPPRTRAPPRGATAATRPRASPTAGAPRSPTPASRASAARPARAPPRSGGG